MASKQSTNSTPSEHPDFVDEKDSGTSAPLNQSESTDIAYQRFDRAQLSSITSLRDAIDLATAQFGGTMSIAETELADGFRKASEKDKESLIRAKLFFLDWQFNVGDYATEFVSIRAIQVNDDGTITKWIINDGGTGIPAELRFIEERTGRAGGLAVPRGLRVSVYKTDAATGKPITKQQIGEYIRDGKKIGQGATYYLDTSA
jgi:hypothetical protein